MKKTNFVFGIHNHQPVGNFHSVFEESFQNGYLPFLELLRKYPKIKTTIHFSGILFSWIKDNHPETIELLKSASSEPTVEIYDLDTPGNRLIGWLKSLFRKKPQ